VSWATRWPQPRRLPWLLLIAAIAVTLDRLTKIWVSAHVPLGGAIPVIDHFLRISHWTNEGAAFSMFADSTSPQAVRWGLVGFASVAALAVLIGIIRLGDRISLTSFALALILGGALGNIFDRVAYGSVIDFVEVHIYHYHYPDFNVADSCVVVGACLLFLDSLLPRRPAQS
jgi:signal peptidase II